MPSNLTDEQYKELRSKYPQQQTETKEVQAPEETREVEELNRAELYEKAQELNIKGRSSMDAEQLARAIEDHEG